MDLTGEKGQLFAAVGNASRWKFGVLIPFQQRRGGRQQSRLADVVTKLIVECGCIWHEGLLFQFAS